MVERNNLPYVSFYGDSDPTQEASILMSYLHPKCLTFQYYHSRDLGFTLRTKRVTIIQLIALNTVPRAALPRDISAS